MIPRWQMFGVVIDHLENLVEVGDELPEKVSDDLLDPLTLGVLG